MKNVVITVLCILVMGLGCFIVYDKVINKGQKNETDTNSISMNDKIIADQLLSVMSIGPCGGEYTYDINVGDTIYYDQLPDEVKFSVAYKNVYADTLAEEISYKRILDSYNNIFGNKNHVLPKTANVPYKFATYELSSDVYKLSSNGGGCLEGGSYSIKDTTVSENSISFEILGTSNRRYIFSFVLDNDHYIFNSIKRIN